MSLKSQRGNALVEFSLVLPLMAALLLGILNYGIAFYNKAVITNASREGARIAIMSPDPLNADNTYPPVSEVTTAVNSYCNNHLITFGASPALQITVSQGASSGSPCTVTVQYQYTFIGVSATPINASTTMLME